MSKLTKPSVEHVELDQETLNETLDQQTLEQVSGGSFLRGGLYQAMQTGGVNLGKSVGTNTEAATISAPICDDDLISQTLFCPAKLTG
jgi:hypothetical protein